MGSRIARWSEATARELRYAFRALFRSPGFSALVILTLALGIGANVAMFDTADRLLFRPLGWLRDPDTVHRIYWQWQDRGATVTRTSSPYTRYLDLRRWTTSFSQLAAFSERPLAVGSGAGTREVRVGLVTASYFSFFDAKPALGRFFLANEDATPRGADVAILSWSFWRSAYGGRDVIGETVRVGDVNATIVGVAPRGFDGVDDAAPPAVWLPITTWAGSTGTGDAATYYMRYNWSWVNILARRAPGITPERAAADASRAFARSWETSKPDVPNQPPVADARPRVAVSAVRTGAGPEPSLEARTALWLGLVAATVLIIACANVANLFLMRVLRARRQTAVQLALGIPRSRLAMRSLLEVLILACAGGVAALILGRWTAGGMQGPLGIRPDSAGFAIAPRTIAFALVSTLAAAMAAGMVPALLSVRRDLSALFRGGMRGGSEGGQLRTALLVAQLALSAVLLGGAALFVRSLHAVRAVPIGYDAERVVWLNRVIRPGAFEDSIQVPLRERLLEAARAQPAVEAAAWVQSAPFFSTSSTALFVAGIDSVGLLGEFTYQATTPDYFRTMGTRILRGRGITDDDRAGSEPVAVVSVGMARVLWPGEEPLGRCFRMRQPDAPCITVVGIAEDIVQRGITRVDRYHYYLPLAQHADRWWGNGMMIRLRGDVARAAEDVRTTLQREVPGAYYLRTEFMSDAVEHELRSWRLGATMFTAFGLLAVIVAAVGLYGGIAYDLTQRLHELGVRAALGATPPDLLRLVVRRSLGWTATGLAIGGLAGLGAARWIQPLLYAQSATDPRVYGAVAAFLLLVSLTATAVPALRAATTDPNRILRMD